MRPAKDRHHQVSRSSAHNQRRLNRPSIATEKMLAKLRKKSGFGKDSVHHDHEGDGEEDDEPFWMELIEHRGTAAYNERPGEYRVFRNVRDFGARGDGRTDDSGAIE